MQAKRNILFFLLSGGFIVFLFSLSLGYFFYKKTDSLAIIKVQSGTVIQSQSLEATAIPQTRQFLIYDLDSILVQEKSLASLITPDGYEIELTPGTQITIEKVGLQLKIAHHQGELRLLKAGTKDSLFVEDSKGSSYEAYQYFSRLVELGLLDQTLPARPHLRENIGTEKSLSDTYISEKLASQKKFFKKCYSHLMQKKPEIVGQMQVYFRLDGNGKVSQVKIPQNPYGDRDFDQCIHEVMTRLRFKAFRGHPMELAFKLSPI